MPKKSNSNATPGVHIVVSGETIAKIAARFGVSVQELAAANPEIKDLNKILVGQKIRIPTSATPSNGAPASPANAAAAPGGAGMPNTDGMNGAQAFAAYAPFLRPNGVDPDTLKPNERIILGLRVTTNVRANGEQGSYDDRIVLIWRDSAGAGHAAEFEANTEPCGRYEDTPQHRKLTPGKIMGEDADLNHVKDLGCLPDGLYHYHKDHSDKGNILRPDHNLFVVRDVNHDGVFDAVDDQLVLSKDRLDSGLTILFHAGGNGMTGSAGCQTFPPKEFAKFWAALGDQRHFEYVLTTVG